MVSNKAKWNQPVYTKKFRLRFCLAAQYGKDTNTDGNRNNQNGKNLYYLKGNIKALFEHRIPPLDNGQQIPDCFHNGNNDTETGNGQKNTDNSRYCIQREHI